VQLARALRELTRAARVPFVMNDRADLALLVDADGLHLGQDDLSIADARRLLGARQLGVSTHDLAQALAAERDGADLIGFGPVFDTQTKERPDPTVGLATLAEVCRTVRVPVVAIGGLTAERAVQAYDAGATWVAAISAVTAAADVAASARAFVPGVRP
jgi:thiamine-phosphate pyrophosphorylase